MQLSEFTALIESYAPLGLAEPWDNCGLLIEPEQHEITRVLVALDCTTAVAQEAVRVGAQLVLTHHPLLFSAVKRLHLQDPDTAAAWMLLRAGIGLYAAHTNLDNAPGGVNDALCDRLGLTDVRPLLHPDAQLSMETAGTGRIARLHAPMALPDFAAAIGRTLHCTPHYAGAAAHQCARIAVVGGSGGDFLKEAKAAGADTLVTGEAKHHEGLAAHAMGVALIVAGHHETEYPVLAPWIKGLQQALGRLQYNVDIILTQAGCAPFCTP